MSAFASSASPRCQHGSSLLEVLVAVLVLSLGMLGLAGMQVAGIKSNQSAQSRSIATIQAYDMLDRLRANLSAAEAGSYNLALAANAVDFDSSSVAKTDLNGWLVRLADELPGGDGGIARSSSAENFVACAGGAGCDYFWITVQWSGLGSAEAGDGAAAERSLQTLVVVGQI